MKLKKIIAAVAAAAMAAISASAISVSAADTYTAYLGIQSASYTFRNAYSESNYGYGTEYFDHLTGWDNNEAVNKGGVFTDVEITGDGTYTVTVTDFDFGDDESLNLLFVSTDMPADLGVTFSDVKIVMDGNTKYTFDEAFMDPDSTDYYSILAINIWNGDLGGSDGLFGYIMPSDSISITFTVSGMGAAAEEEVVEEVVVEEVAEEATEAVVETTTVVETAAAATGNASMAAVAAVVAVAGAAVVVSKKSK